MGAAGLVGADGAGFQPCAVMGRAQEQRQHGDGNLYLTSFWYHPPEDPSGA